MIKFGMTVAEMIGQLTRGFTKQTGRLPSGLEKIKIQQEAIQRSKDMNKVLDMKGNPIDPAKPIMGGEQLPENKGLGNVLRKKLMKTDNPFSDLVKTTEKGPKSLQQRRLEAEEALRNKNVVPIKDPPEELAYGGVAGLLGERTGFMAGGLGRRGFLKMLAGAGAGIAGVKTGLFGLGKKAAVKEVVQQTAGSGAPPAYFFKLVDKIRKLGDDAPRLAVKDREKVTTFKEYQLTEDVTTGEQTIQRMKVTDPESASYYGQPLTEETYMSYKPGKGQGDEMTKGRNIPDEYEEGTALLRNDGMNAGEVVEESAGISDEIFEEIGEAVPEAIRKDKADGGRIGYAAGKGVTSLLNLVKKKFGKKSITTADKIATPQKTLDRDMFKKADDRLNDKREMTADELEDFEMEIGDNLEAYDFDGTVGSGKQILKEQKDYMDEMYADYKKASPSERRQVINSGKPDRVPEIWENEFKLKEAVEDIFPTGDYKYDAQMASEALVENNPKVFKDRLFDDLDEGTQLEIYSAVSEQIGKSNANMRQIKKGLSTPTKTLESMKSGKGIDMSDPDIADEFTKFMKENDPKGYKDMEEKVIIESFDPKGRKGNAYGGRIGLLAGGGVLKKLIQNLSKEKGMSGSEVLKVMNWKSLPSEVKNLMTKEEFGRMKAQRLEGVEIWKDLMLSQQDMTKNIDAGKNTPAAGLFEELEKTSPGYGIVPRDIADEDILQMEQMIKNMKTKDNRQLNATGGIASMLGE